MAATVVDDRAGASGSTSTSIAEVPLPATKLNRLDILPLAIIVLFACLLCLPIFTGKVPFPSETLHLWSPWNQIPHEPITNPNLADATLIYLPSMVFARDAVAQGEWPLWDPYSFGGFPYSANSQSQLYYPLTWLLWLLPLPSALQVLPLFNILLAGVGMYLFGRSQTLSRIAALVSSLAFAGSGMMQLALEIPGVASVYGWLPWMLLTVDKAISTRSNTWSALGALVCGLQVLAGHLQWVLYSYFLLGIWVLWEATYPQSKQTVRQFASTTLRGFVIAVGGLALAAIHLAPFLELSGIAGRTASRVSSNSWPLSYLLRLVTPEYFGSAAPGVGVPLIFNDLWYVGIAPLFLAVLAIVLRPSRDVWLWLAMSLLAIAVTFGIGPFLYARWLPGLSALLPMRIGYIFIFATAMLAGIGFDAFMSWLGKMPRFILSAVLGVGLLFVGVLAVAWSARAPQTDVAMRTLQEQQLMRALILLAATFGLLLLTYIVHKRLSVRSLMKRYTVVLPTTLLLALLMFDLGTLLPGYNSFVSPDSILPSTPAIDWLKPHAGYERVMGVDSPGPVLNPNSQSLFGLYSVAGYDSLHPRRLEEYWGSVDPGVSGVKRGSPYSNVFVRPQAYTSTLAALMNVRYILSDNSFVPDPSLKAVYKGEASVYENPDALPRAFLVEAVEQLDPLDLLARISMPNFDPMSAVLIEEEPPQNMSATRSIQSPPPGKVSITSYRRNSVTLEADLDRAAWLVLADPNYPGWTVTVDGQSEKVYTAYYQFRAVPLKNGPHRIVFSFVPTNFLGSSLISGTVLVITVTLLAVGILRSLTGRTRKSISVESVEGERAT